MATEYFAVNQTDDNSNGDIRPILEDACNRSGNDTITFLDSGTGEFKIKLTSPLVIPEDCNGTIAVKGIEETDIVLDGSKFTEGGDRISDSCIINIYSDNNAISQISLINNNLGAGICVFGKNNSVAANRIGVTLSGSNGTNRYGLIISNIFKDTYNGMDGSSNSASDNLIQENTSYGIYVIADTANLVSNQIIGNGADGIWFSGSDGIISSNEILANGGCPSDTLFSSQTDDCLSSGGIGGAGIYVADGSKNTTIGGETFEADKNTIEYNENGGIVVAGDATKKINISHNTISRNYGSTLGLDLGDDDVTANDTDDQDSGANKLLNHADYIQAFPLVPSPSGDDRYWAWGVAITGSDFEVYSVSEEDMDRDNLFAGGERYLADADFGGILMHSLFVQDIHTFSLTPEENALQAGEGITLLTHDSTGNTSEFLMAAAVGEDSDLDGVLDDTENGISQDSSEADNSDSDGDSLSDGTEDINHNGIWDESQSETCAYKADSDDDGQPDWYETHGKATYTSGTDTDPLDPDTDNDGLSDGAEDNNHNGIYEIYLGETNPLIQDTDADGHLDGSDNCPSVYNPGQEAWYCTF